MTTYLTDGGLETDLIYHHGVDLPDFAAFPLLDRSDGRAVLREYYSGYARLAASLGTALLLETPTWRANPDHAAGLGYDVGSLDRINRDAVAFLAGVAEEYSADLFAWEVGGILGPREDGYRSDGPVDPDEAAAYHRPQLASFHAAGATRATVLTLTDVGEAIGVARAGADVGIPTAIGFTVETDGRLPDGSSVADAIAVVDADTPPTGFLLNCAHPTHILAGSAGDSDHGEESWRGRVHGLRVNASRMSHPELDAAEELDDGDPTQLAADHEPLFDAFGSVQVLGGCCGTDLRHVAAIWGTLHSSGGR